MAIERFISSGEVEVLERVVESNGNGKWNENVEGRLQRVSEISGVETDKVGQGGHLHLARARCILVIGPRYHARPNRPDPPQPLPR